MTGKRSVGLRMASARLSSCITSVATMLMGKQSLELSVGSNQARRSEARVRAHALAPTERRHEYFPRGQGRGAIEAEDGEGRLDDETVDMRATGPMEGRQDEDLTTAQVEVYQQKRAK
jgi:hypothetical protein